MKQLLTAIIIALTAAAGMRAQEAPATYFPYPQPPDTMEMIQNRVNYFIEHFWDRCEVKKAFSSRAKMQEAFADYVQILGSADDSIAAASIDRFMHSLDKQPKDQAFIVEEAEKQLYGDSAQYWSDDLYIKFAKPFIANKKGDKNAKLRPAMLVRILESTAIGQRPPELKYVTREGEEGSTAGDVGQMVIYFFNDPDCSDCAMARVRLDADIRASQLVASGALKVVSIYPGEATDEWREGVAGYPAAWRVVAAADADEVYDLRSTPVFYVVHRGKILGKNLNINQVLTLLSRL